MPHPNPNPLRIDGTDGLIEMTNDELLTGAQAVGFSTGINISATEPVGPADGDLWWNSTDEELRIYSEDDARWVLFATLQALEINTAAARTVGTDNNTYIVFNATETIELNKSQEFEYLIVGGGGGGGDGRGGNLSGGGGRRELVAYSKVP